MKALNQCMAANYLRGIGPRSVVLLLTTIGRKSGLRRVTPLQFEEVDGRYYIASARGREADWLKNILANPQVTVQIGENQFNALAEPVTDPCRIADFLEVRLCRHPRMVGAILRSAGISPSPSRPELEAYAAQLAIVIIHPRP